MIGFTLEEITNLARISDFQRQAIAQKREAAGLPPLWSEQCLGELGAAKKIKGLSAAPDLPKRGD